MRNLSIAALWLGCALLPDPSAAADQADAKSDPITTLVKALSASHLWRNGTYPDLELPATASPDEVIARMFEKISFADGQVTQYRILETRLVQIPEHLPYTNIPGCELQRLSRTHTSQHSCGRSTATRSC